MVAGMMALEFTTQITMSGTEELQLTHSDKQNFVSVNNLMM